MYMDDDKLQAKNEKQQELLIQMIRIYNQDIGMESGIVKCTMLLTKSKKKQKQWTEQNCQIKKALKCLG